MKLMWISAFILLFASLAALISKRHCGELIADSLATSASVFPESKLSEMQRAMQAYTGGVFERLPEPFRQKFAATTGKAVELMTFRCLVLWHLMPGFVIPLMIGFLEGSWARTNQKTLVKMHSPMRFSLALSTLGLIPVLALLWISAPMALPVVLLVFAVGTMTIVSTRNLIVHAPTQF